MAHLPASSVDLATGSTVPERPLKPGALVEDMPPEAMQQIAQYFQALSEPTRLQILNLLCAGERKVGDIAQRCGYSAATISRHLALLARQGMVLRQERGSSVYYRIADDSLFEMCRLVCGSIGRRFSDTAASQAAFGVAAVPGAGVAQEPG